MRPAGSGGRRWTTRSPRPPAPTGTLFSVNAGGRATVGVPGSVNGLSAVMVTQEPAGGTLAPTSAPVIVAPVT